MSHSTEGKPVAEGADAARDLPASLQHVQDVREGLEQLAAIVESSDDAIVSKTLDGVIRSWNAGAERIFGFTADEAIGRPITLIIPPERHAEEDAILAKIRSGERIDHFETVRVTRDGRRIPISLSVSPMRNAQGRIVGAAKIARDFSERVRVEQAIEHARGDVVREAQALRSLNACSTRLWCCQSLDEGFERMLDAAIELLGADRAAIRLVEGSVLRVAAQRGFDASCDACLREVGIDSGCARAVRSRTREIVADVLADPDFGPFRTASIAAGCRTVVSSPLVAADGSVLGVIDALFAQARQPEERQLRAMDLFVRQASDFVRRSRMEQALRASEAALRESDRRKSEFLATLAHELRNPLAPISSGLHILELAHGDPQILEQTRVMMRRQVDHMTRLVEDLMDVSRIGQGKIDLRLHELDFNAILQSVAEAHRPRIEGGGHILLVKLSPQPLPLRADATRLTQVVANLLTNAAKYTPPGGVITLLSHRDDRHAVASVRDSGIGIPAHMLDRVFELFTQVDGSLDRSEGGVGIGLSLVKGLVEAHGGTATVHSEGPGQGSEFVVRLPLAEPDGPP